MGLFGNRNKSNKTINNVFREYYEQAMDVINRTEWKDSIIAKTDLGPMMYVVADLVAFNSGMDRRAMINSICLEWEGLIRKYENASEISKVFDERSDFYAMFIRGKRPSMSFWFGSDKPDLNPVLSVVAAFCDVLFNPERMDDYDHYSVLIHPIEDSLSFTPNIFFPLSKIIVQFYGAVQALK